MVVIKKKLLVYAHYYYPDVASTGQILRELCEGMKDKFDITVICVVPSYSGKVDEKYTVDKYYHENINGVKVIRVRVPEFIKGNKKSRIKNLVTYFFRAVWTTLKLKKQDYIFTISQPPILGGVLGIIGKWFKGGKLIYNIQDFNPEQTIAVGYSKNKLILNMAMWLDKFSCKRADKVIVVGRDMQETLRNRFKSKKVPKNVFINNWIDEKEIYPLQDDNEKVIDFKKKYGLEDKTVVMYSGNIGLYYDLENLIKIIGRFKDRDDVVFAFVGDGTKKQDIEAYVNEHKLRNAKFIPYQDKADLNYSLNAGDVHWVVNAKGIKGVSVPSKLYGVMAAGKTVFGVLDEGSEARLIIEECGCGVCIEPGKYDFIYEELKKIVDNIDEYKRFGIRGKDYIDKYIKKDVAIEKYSREILCEDEVVEVDAKERISFKSNYFKIFMKLNKVSFGKNLNLFGVPVIFKKSGSVLKIGDNCSIKSSFLSNLIGLSQRTIIVTRTKEAKIEIGNNVGISGATIYARKGISIGDNTLIGGNVKILDNDFHPIEGKDRKVDIKEKIGTKPILIGRNCFIGCNALILKGTVLGDGCVVGAGAVVCGKFEENSVIVGNPAKVIKKL